MVFQPNEPIAIVGSGCRFPGGANSPSALWKLLVNPWDVQKEIPDTRFNPASYYHPNSAHHGTSNVRHSYLLDEDIRTFDAQFFNINPVEADSMDPQQRLLMETVFESVESAGLTIEGLRGSDTSVFVGVMSVDYQDILIRDIKNIPTYQSTGVSRSILSNRISYFFDWRGPSMTIDTACSSSMVAVHQAVQALRNGESGIAIAAGTELILGPENYVAESKMNLLSPTGRSRMWDADADGYARGDGVAAVVLKKLKDALRDGDHVECIIRETGVNQDGRTNGLTVPSSEAQASLIRRTYARAGLNIADPRDQPHFFEAHGTGTRVGDPREAAAIAEAFFNDRDNTRKGILHVGSIKTIIGHTEGTAGVAGILKGSLALQHGVIPPNLLFKRLNPSIKPYYNSLRIPTEATPWPVVPDGCPRRVSVNSFGFGGTNGHAILESYPQTTGLMNSSHDKIVPFTPFPLSAVSETALVSLLKAYSDYLKVQDSINMRDLAWTLQIRRSIFPVRIAFSGTDSKHLASKIDTALEEAGNDPENSIGSRKNSSEARILGVFTGQGAQWATMGAHLIRSSAFVRDRLRHLDESLAMLPEHDRPTWLICTELLADKLCSRIGEAELSQPLCTAIQIVLVDLLRSAGLEFAAVVGHSSGEIAAAYAAGYISDRDAIRIAYYRGLTAKQAGLNKHKGAMLAVGTSLEDAQKLCGLPEFSNRLCIAAHNSSASITLSGDVDAVEQAKSVFKQRNTFVRQLMVDTAYHSHHMLPFGDAYIKSLRSIKIKLDSVRRTRCTWYSSVIPGKIMEPTEELKDIYWRDNLVKPVLFAEAIVEAAKMQTTVAIEIGPHPALKAPATQNIAEVQGTSPPYIGVLNRGNNDIESFSDCLGFIWAHFGHQAVDFESVEKLLAPHSKPKLLKGLPSYPWDHSRVHWHESRVSRKMRAESTPLNQILGFKSPDSTDNELRWTNLLKPSEIRWLSGHKLQGQTVFPAAGYISMAIEASKSLAGEKEVEYFELHDLVIKKAITFDDDTSFAVETLVVLTVLATKGGRADYQEADFSCYSCVNGQNSDLELVASARVNVIYGKAKPSTLPSTRTTAFNMNRVDRDRFYSTLQDLGYGYSGAFKGLSGLARKLDQSTALISSYPYDHPSETLVVHPATLDVAFQAIFLAQTCPGDQKLWALHVPVSIRCIRINTYLSESIPLSGTKLPVHAILTENSTLSICGDVDVRSEDGENTIIQVEGLTMVPFSPATAADDCNLFSYTQWIQAAPNTSTMTGEDRATCEEVELATLCERLGYYYLRKWKVEIGEDEWARAKWHHQRLQDYVNHLLALIAKGEHPHVRKEWVEDSASHLQEMISKYPASVDLKLISAVGENMPAVVRGETTILEHMTTDNMLDDLYQHGIGAVKYNTYLARIAQQISRRYPHMKILEIGAGTGSATKSILKSLGTAFSSYTYTDVSTAFFDKASNIFREYSHKMIFKPFDVERAPASQGFEESAYDMIIASNVLHATRSLQSTLENTHRLLRPGGYLLMLEITNNGPIRFASMTSGLPGWWVGVDDGRIYTPTVTPSVWDRVLRISGFSGIDATMNDHNGLVWPFSVISTQAVDWRVNFLREPLSFPPRIAEIEQLVILGTELPETGAIAKSVAGILRKYCKQVTILRGLPLEDHSIAPNSTFLNLVDIDEPIFKNLTTEKMNGLKRLLNLSKNMLWIIKGCQEDEPYHMATVGFGRTICHEMPHLRLQFLDVDNLQESVSHMIAETLLRLIGTGEWESKVEFDSDMLWTTEPELMVKGGQLLLPRVLPNHEQNARLNSRRRFIAKDVDLSESIVSIHRNSKFIALQHGSLKDQPDSSYDQVIVSHSMLPAVRVTSESFLFLGIGTSVLTGETVAYLSDTNSSRVVPAYCSSISACPRDRYAQYVAAIVGQLMVKTLVGKIPYDSTLLVHEPDPAIVPSLLCQAKEKRIHVLLSTVLTERTMSFPWIYLHPLLAERSMKDILPPTISYFVDLSIGREAREVGLRISQILGSALVSFELSTLFRDQSFMSTKDGGEILSRLEDAVSRAETNLSQDGIRPVALRDIGDLDTSKTLAPSVIDWSTDQVLSVQIHPSTSDGLFSRNKTYFLIGLTGQLGQSLCEWMARNGAGYVCLTSRSPNVEEEWIKSIERLGTTVKIFKMDITSREDLHRVYNELHNTLPPIAGVANAAMVLNDMEFAQMSVEAMKSVWAPKIDGSNYLDELFYDHHLDFFVLFSSLSFIYGNTGQTSYASANGYLTSLVSRRRKRGYAASAIDISQLAGMGYVERTGHALQDRLFRYGFMRISESDFHEIMAETIRVGRLNSRSNPVVTVGIRAARDDEEVKVLWFNNPRLSHFIVEAKTSNIKARGRKVDLSASDQLRNAGNRDSIMEILKKHVSAQLQHILHLPSEKFNQEDSLVDLGIDSLAAVEVRSWILRELKTDVPVLQVLGSNSVADLCGHILEKLPDKQVPGGDIKAL